MTDHADAKQRAREEVRGLWIAIPTPFTDDGSRLDEDLLVRGVEHYIDAVKVDGIFCGGVMGEFWALSLEERKRVHELVVQQAAGRVPIMTHVGSHVFGDMVELTRHAAGIGARFGIAMNPYYPLRQNDDMVRAWYRRLYEEAPDLPMFLFNTRYSGYALSPELIDELADLPNVCGIKNPGARDHIARVLEVAGDRLVVADASETNWLSLRLDLGLQALMSTPELALYQWRDHTLVADYDAAADAGDLDRAWDLHARLAAPRQLGKKWLKGSYDTTGVIPIAALKAWLTMMGVPQGPVRPPLLPLTEDQQGALESDLAKIGIV